jgi:carboxyl-terminal processing protease
MTLLLAILLLHGPGWAALQFTALDARELRGNAKIPRIGASGYERRQEPRVPERNQMSADLRNRTLNLVWRTVKDKHFDPTFGGVDWDKVRDEYRGRILSANDDREFYRMLDEMVGTLHLSHLRVFSREQLDEQFSTAGGGIDLRVIDGAATITRIDAESPASRAGLRPGFVISRVDDVAIVDVFEKVRADQPAARRVQELRDAVLDRMRGQPGTAFRIKYLDETDSEREIMLTREAAAKWRAGADSTYFGDIEAKKLDRGIGYIRFREFNPHVATKLVASLESMKDAPGIIIDLRGNHGGDDSVGWKLARHLIAKPTLVCLERTRRGVQQQRIKPASRPYLGPVAILVDGFSVSAAEQFAAPLQELGRATIVGEKTLGVDLDANVKKLPAGALLLYVVGEPTTPNGVVIEGRGVTPDIQVSVTRNALLKGVDEQLKAAIAYINKPRR